MMPDNSQPSATPGFSPQPTTSTPPMQFTQGAPMTAPVQPQFTAAPQPQFVAAPQTQFVTVPTMPAAPATVAPQATPTATPANNSPVLVPVKKKIPFGPIIGAIVVIAVGAAAFFIANNMGLFNNDPAIGKYALYSTLHGEVEDVDSVTGLKLMGLSMSVEFRRDGTGKVSATSTHYEGEDAINFTWKDGAFQIVEEDKNNDITLKMNTMTKYELASNESYIVISNDTSDLKVKFKRIAEEN